MRRWYQTIEIENVNAVFEDVNRKNSRFWNEGKWNNFVDPLLPKERQTFLEIGCNAGLFLKMAADEGFENIVGVEGNRRIMQQAEIYREHIKGKYRLVPQIVGKNLILDDLPVLDVVLISNAHYYFSVGAFSKLVDDLRNRSLYCIVVSAKAKRRQGNAFYDLASVRGYFRDWEEVDSIIGINAEGDSAPREQMYGVLFKGNLHAVDVDEYYGAWWEASKKNGHKSKELAPVMREFLERVLSGEQFEYDQNPFYDYWRRRMPRKHTEWTRALLTNKAFLAKDIQANGIKEPIYIDPNGKLLDGLHRLSIAKLLGYKHILGRIL